MPRVHERDASEWGRTEKRRGGVFNPQVLLSKRLSLVGGKKGYSRGGRKKEKGKHKVRSI